MKFDVIPYVFSHGRLPRGRGSWAFVTSEHHGTMGEQENTVFSPSMTYSDARRWVSIHPEFTSSEIIIVLP